MECPVCVCRIIVENQKITYYLRVRVTKECSKKKAAPRCGVQPRCLVDVHLLGLGFGWFVFVVHFQFLK